MTTIEGVVAVALAAIAAFPASIIAWTGLKKVSQALAVQTQKTESIEKKTDEIKHLADGNLTKVNQSLTLQTQKVESLERLLALAIHSDVHVPPVHIPPVDVRSEVKSE